VCTTRSPLAKSGPGIEVVWQAGQNLIFLKKKLVYCFTYLYDHPSSPAPGIYFIHATLVNKQALRLYILMSAHWPEGSIGRIIGFADRGPARGCTGALLR